MKIIVITGERMAGKSELAKSILHGRYVYTNSHFLSKCEKNYHYLSKPLIDVYRGVCTNILLDDIRNLNYISEIVELLEHDKTDYNIIITAGPSMEYKVINCVEQLAKDYNISKRYIDISL